jgi:histidinol phosphatase-like PHP family hydrolase
LNLNLAGQGDMEADALKHLDFVLGCFHSSLRKEEDQTERYLSALRNPLIQTLGHPRGRIYNFRLGLNADWPRVFELAAELDKAVEPGTSGSEPELDQAPAQLRFIELGAAAALFGGIKEDRILNFITREQLLEWAKSVGRTK